MRQLCKHGIDHDHACQQCDLASLSGFGAPVAAPDVEARLSELQLGEIRDELAGDKRGWYPWAARKLLRELDAAQKEIAELRGELVGTKGMLDKADATVALYGRWLEEREEQLTGAERRGFAQGVEAAVTWLKGRSERDFGYWFAEKIARALQFAGPSPAELQPPPEGTREPMHLSPDGIQPEQEAELQAIIDAVAVPPVSEPVRYVRPEFHIEPDETSDFGATPEDGYRNGFREGVKRTEDEAWSWRKAAEDAQIQLEALRGELRSLKDKPAGAVEPGETSDFGETSEDGYRNGFREGAAPPVSEQLDLARLGNAMDPDAPPDVSEYERGLEEAAVLVDGFGLSTVCPVVAEAIRSLKGKPAGPAGGEGGA